MGEAVESLAERLRQIAQWSEEDIDLASPELLREAAATLERVERDLDVEKSVVEHWKVLYGSACADKAIAEAQAEVSRKALQWIVERDKTANSAAALEMANVARAALASSTPESSEQVELIKELRHRAEVAEVAAALMAEQRDGLLQTQESAVYPVPAGWRLVPDEITGEMQHAYFDVVDANLSRVQSDPAFGRYESQCQAYRAMLAAAPAPAEARSVDPTAPTVLDVAWININVLGAPNTACRTPEDLAYCRGIGDALAEIEKLGGQPS